MSVYLHTEAKQDLMSYIAFIKDMVSESERNLTKEEKVTFVYIRIL